MPSGKATRRLRQQTKRAGVSSPQLPSVEAYGHGIPLAAEGAHLRFARIEDSSELLHLMSMAGANVAEGLPDSLRTGLLASNLKRGLAEGRTGFISSLSASFRGARDPILGTSLALVVEADGAVLAGGVAGPPGGYLRQATAMVPGREGLKLTMQGVMGTAKLLSVATQSESEGQGFGSALVRHIRSIYVRLGYLTMYGSFEEVQRHLQAFYAGLGFEVLRPGQPVDLSNVLGRAGGPVPVSGERMFVDARLPGRSPLP